MIILPERWGLFADFCRFARAQVQSGDIDPAYPVLRAVYAAEGFGPAVALWRTLLYVAWYDLGSAERAGWMLSPGPVNPARAPLLPTGTERRGLRGEAGRGRAAQFLNAAWAAAGGDLPGWVAGLARDRSPAEGWTSVRRAFEALPHAGPWASYKWADLLRNVHGIPIEAPDIGSKLGETAGPIPGMVRLTGRPWQECAGTPSLQRALLEEARAGGAPLGGLDQLETCLCDFNSLLKGGYYHGHDIDGQQEALARAGMGGPWWAAREACFPARYRGEAMGWRGVRPALKGIYRDQGRLVNL